MSRLRITLKALRDERGLTLIELLVAMSLGIIVTGIAFSLLNFTTADVTRISERVHVDQTGRVALEKLMLALHSSCVATKAEPIRFGSSEKILRFVSETSGENAHGEPTSSLPTIRLREVIYTEASGKKEGTLTENSWPSTGVPPKYEFNEAETPTKRTLLTGIKRTEGEKKELIKIFRYYRYYKTTDTKPTLGELDPTELVINSKASTSVQKEEAAQIAKVAVSFTAVPEGKENKEDTSLGNGRPVALEDSAILRLSPSSEESNNLPCAEL
ncbi:MAG TPA: prepilin-type N-terminal cleavage/methylation domain-containing protein [Solirubrobacteraceae bacterium]